MIPTTTVLHGHGGIRLVADVYPAEGTERPPVILLHGGGQNRHAWAGTASALNSAGYPVVAYDTRGHGDSGWDPTGRYDTDDLARDLLAVRDQACSGRPSVAVGASMGGMTILSVHRLAPADRWHAVVLVDVTPRLEIAGARRIVQFMSAHPDGFATLEEAAEIIAAYNPHRPRPDSVEGLHKVLHQRADGRWVWRWDPAFILSKTEAMDAEPEGTTARLEHLAGLLLDGARRITAPTLLVRGALSDLVSPETVEEFLDAVPHACTVDVSHTGHMVAGDDNSAFTAAVIDFLTAIRSPCSPG